MKTILQKSMIIALYMLFVTGSIFGAAPNTIVVNSMSSSSSCYGPAVSISVIFTKGGAFAQTNQFIAQLSDASGNWTSPINIGSITSNVSNGFPIPSTIPLNTAAGSGYKIRVVSTNPVATSGNSLSYIINPLPAAYAGISSTICSGNSIIIGTTPVAGNTYSWVSSPAGFTSSSANPTISPTITTTYTLTETITATGCSKSNSITITANPLPTVTANATVSTLCAGGSTILSGGGASSYTWSGGVSDGVSFVPASTTTYTVTGTDANACSNTATKTITVNPLPTVTASATVSTLCAGASTVLSGSGASSYVWSGGVTNGVSFIPASTTTYTVTGTDANGCSNTATKTITVNPLPAANAGSSSRICLGNDATIGAAAVVGNTYNWASSPSGFVSTSANPTVNPTVTTSYTLTETITETGCQESNAVTITVNPLPIVTLGIFPTAYLPSTTYPLTSGSPSGGTYSGTGVSGTNFNPTQVGAGNYVITYTYTDVNGCTNFDTSSIFVRVPDTKVRTADCGITLSTLNQLMYCDKVLGATGYEWKLEANGSSNTFNQTSSNTYFRPSYLAGISYGTTYTVYVRAKIGSSSGTFNASCIISTPILVPNTKLRSADCGITLSSLDQLIFCNPVSGASAYEWKLETKGFSKTFYQSSSNTYFRPSYLSGISYATNYTVSVRARAGTTWGVFDSTCTISTPIEVQYTKVRASDCGITLSNLDQLIYCDPVSGAQAYEWRFEATEYSKTFIQSSSNTYFRPSWITDLSLGTTYTVAVRARAGTSWGKFNVTCEISTPSGKQMQTINEENNFMETTKAGNNETKTTEKLSETVAADKDFNVYPNPNSGIINILTSYNVGVIEIYNQLGQIVYSEKIIGNKTTIDLSKLNNGEYILKAKNTQGTPRLCELSLCDTDSGTQIKTIVIKK